MGTRELTRREWEQLLDDLRDQHAHAVAHVEAIEAEIDRHIARVPQQRGPS